jgi:hypothetical protein
MGGAAALARDLALALAIHAGKATAARTARALLARLAGSGLAVLRVLAVLIVLRSHRWYSERFAPPPHAAGCDSDPRAQGSPDRG